MEYERLWQYMAYFNIFYECSMIFIMECETLFMKARFLGLFVR